MFLKILSILCASTLPFLFSLKGDFVFDDSEAIVKNEAVKSESWLYSFHTDYWGTNISSNLSHKSYRPLTVWSFRLNYLLSGKSLSAVDFKVTNLICHIISCLLLWLMLENVLGRLRVQKCKRCIDVGWWATLLFCVHPVHVEAVCGAVGRADLLAAVTCFLAFLSYNIASFKTHKQYLYLLTSIIMAAMSMLFKENGITILGVCLCYEFILKYKEGKRTKKKSLQEDLSLRLFLSAESIIRMTVLVLAILLLLYGRWIIMGRAVPNFNETDNPAAFSDSKLIKMGTFSYLYFLNALLLVWPQWLCYDWSMGCVPLIDHFPDYRLIFVVIMYIYGASLVMKIFNGRKKESSRITLLALSLMVTPFLPAANIFYPVGFVVAERVLYIPSAGYCLLMVVGLNRMSHSTIFTRKIIYSSFSFLVCVFALKSYERSFAWQNEHKLFLSGLSVCPLNAKVHYNVAKVADAKHHTDLALAEYREAIRLYPKYYQAMNNLANLLKNRKEYTEAEYYLRKAINHKQNFPAAWMNLGILLASKKQYQEAKKAYENALKYRHNYPDCLYNLGNLYLDTNKSSYALETWMLAIKLKPTHKLAWTNILALLDNTGQLDKAQQIIPSALSFLPEVPSVRFAIANIYGKMGQYEMAERHFLKTIELLGPKVQAIHFANLGVLYHRWSKYELAEKMYRRALKVDSNFKSALKNLLSLQRIKL
ncbi:protein O-mannosyl-transferase F38B6.6-like [Choristoneura fumiferana]|uniref:protein O-mannosyl-transferase F38B6.6-like n=1 Tax=Choristoneura fumiferana TaxID=7141 RepID=UPI003D15879D